MAAIAASRSWKCVRNHKLAQKKIVGTVPTVEIGLLKGKPLVVLYFSLLWKKAFAQRKMLSRKITPVRVKKKKRKILLIMEEFQNTGLFILLLTCLLRIFRFFLANTFSNKARGNKYLVHKATRGKWPTVLLGITGIPWALVPAEPPSAPRAPRGLRRAGDH